MSRNGLLRSSLAALEQPPLKAGIPSHPENSAPELAGALLSTGSQYKWTDWLNSSAPNFCRLATWITPLPAIGVRPTFTGILRQRRGPGWGRIGVPESCCRARSAAVVTIGEPRPAAKAPARWLSVNSVAPVTLTLYIERPYKQSNPRPRGWHSRSGRRGSPRLQFPRTDVHTDPDSQGRSSVGRATDSKSVGRRFDSFRPCS